MDATENQDDLIIKQQREIEKEVSGRQELENQFSAKFLFYFVDFRIFRLDLGRVAGVNSEQRIWRRSDILTESAGHREEIQVHQKSSSGWVSALRLAAVDNKI